MTGVATPTIDSYRADEEAMARTDRALREAEREVWRLEKIIAPADDAAPTLDAMVRLEAQLALTDAKTACQQAKLVALKAVERFDLTRTALRAAQEADFNAARRDIITRLVPHLLAARVEVDKLVALSERAPHPDLFLWAPLQSGDARGAFQPTLDLFIESARAYGWLLDSNS